MGTTNSISMQIPEADLQAAKDALANVKSILYPYMLALSPRERKTLLKMSDKSEPFVSKVMDYAASDPEFVPPYVDMQEMQKDWKAVQQLIPLMREVSQLHSNLSDTAMLAGSETFTAALSYYHSVKQAAKQNVTDAKIIYDDLAKRFQRPSNGKSDPIE